MDYLSHYDLIEEIGEANCRAAFDAWAPALQGTDILAAARKMASITVQTTMANYQLRPRFRYSPAIVNYERLVPAVQAVPMDEGFIDYRAFLSALEEGGFKGAIAYEMCSPLRGGGTSPTSIAMLAALSNSWSELLIQSLQCGFRLLQRVGRLNLAGGAGRIAYFTALPILPLVQALAIPGARLQQMSAFLLERNVLRATQRRFETAERFETTGQIAPYREAGVIRQEPVS